MRSVVNNSDRVQWNYTLFESVSPLRFGMSHEEAATAMKSVRVEGPGQRARRGKRASALPRSMAWAWPGVKSG